MPVGVSLVNSSLKNSFSLSSLQQTPSENTPEKAAVKQRQFNSLTKNRVKATAVRKSWGSTASDHREEFWSVLQANYNYIMDNNLIDKCQEVNGDLATQTGTWTLREFYAQFSELYSWLNSVQETIYGKEENITDKALRARCVNKVLEKSSSLKLFNDQASQLVHLYPEVQEEVGWRTTHLNSKWDSILSILGPSDCEMCDQDTCLDIDHELKCLRSWFKIMESCLQPLDFRAKYTKTEIETKALELNVLHRDIENHGKIVGSVVKLCKRPDAKCNTANARRIANGLERRWHLLFLRSLEWQCYLESLSKRQHFKNSASSSDESDSDCYREPVSKYPRLSGREPYHRTYHSQPEDCDSSEEDDAYSVESNEAVMNDTSALKGASEEIDVVDGAISIGADSSQFTQSNKKAPNLATYYFKHEDTDSDMDRIDSFPFPRTDGQTSTLDETSEEEWTYTRTEPAIVPDSIMEVDVTLKAEDVEEQIVPKAKAMSEDKIRMLVQKAEELVSPEKCRKMERSNSLKLFRVNKWLSLEKPDSCDASAEEDERESQTSEEIDASTMTLKDSHNTLYPELNSNWCGSYGSRLDVPSANATGINYLSISESALHKMTLSPKTLDRFSLSTNSFNINGNHSTSSTVEEVSPLVTEKASPMRRKKSKLKKKALFGKSDPRLLHSPGAIKHRNMLIKSGSFSGYSLQRSEHERHSTSDPSAVHHCAHLWCEVSTTSGADTDDDSRKRIPSFKSGTNQRYTYGSEMREDSPGKFSLNATESSSLSEAWDNYQEPYLSEPYSESHDSDAARRLLNFGEDYRNFIDSQSDWSALSDVSPKFKRKVFAQQQQQQSAEESNSDEESLKQLINESRVQLKYAQDVFEHVKDGISNVTSEIDQLVSTCDSHIALLSHITESPDEYKMLAGDKAVTTGLLSQWRTLRIRSVKMQEYRRLQKELSDLKMFITNLEVPENNGQFHVNNTSADINNEIEACNITLDMIKNHSSRLASINAAVHRFTLENQDFDDFSKCTLKAEVSELYELFNNAKTRISTKLTEIENLLPGWKMLESRLEQLQRDLLEDGKTLHLLDAVLTNGQFTDQTATCVRDVAKVLSESTSYQGYPLPEFFTEGSFSDSGISDEGSEHEIGERQGRLAAIRRLVRQLEMGLSPDSKARLIMREKLSAAEEELKALQLRCRNLIVRTAAVSHPVLEKISQKNKRMQTKAVKPDGGDDDPGNDPHKTKWLKRLFKTSLAFQLVILTFVCISCWYEPQCCDYMNNYQWSVSPKLHYEGKPPI